MTRQELGDASTSIVAEGADIVMERVFDAPRELVWAAMTSPEHIPNWWGPHGNHADVQEMDVRPGGKWRIGPPQGTEGVAFGGEFLQVVRPERFVRTSSPDMPGMDGGGPPAVETVTLEDLGGKTKMVYQGRFPSEDVLEFALAQGMTKGVLEQFDRLAALLAEIG
ncbi:MULTISPECIES: SRPBCC domain-containing protein [Thermomonosporaceae]|uniref:SRPBCC domain-containing protein n=1 Tax=Thermomonosporaceae TaxID=2012 RepID=UPI00255B0304|nr:MULTISPECIES: SRPBCC domain-containing protein [Thermomonosporaceae]MDL4770596.1 SRPBCC domain-containing protein [Actinomadura xylanilytica]